jgi:hypothetical protein
MLDITIRASRPRVDSLFLPFTAAIGNDFEGYRNHVYRCITYAMHFLKNAPEHEQIVETAFVYHDIGLWTDKALAYLEPSEALALRDNEAIEACRKADWIDATQGWCRKGITRLAISQVESAFPNCGFHKSLMRLAKDYGGSTPIGGLKVVRGIIKW